MKKQSAFKMKGFSGFGNSPVKQNVLKPHKDIKPDKPHKFLSDEAKEVKQTEPKKNKRTNFNVSNPPVKPKGNGGTIRPISGFEADFPKTKRILNTIVDAYSPKQNVKRFKKIVKNTSKKAKQVINYFKAK